MNYQLFLKEIEEVVKEKVEQDFHVYINSVLKNNGIELDAIVILKEGENVSPNIYLEYYYDRYCDGVSLDEVGDEILAVYQEAVHEKQNLSGNYLDFENYKDSLFYRVVHYEKNKNLLQEMPHIRYLELAVTFHCMISESPKGIQSYCISQRILDYWKLTAEELYQIAKKNTPRLFPPQISAMEELLFGLEKKETNASWLKQNTENTKIFSRQEYRQYLKEMLEEVSFDTDLQMYVMTNCNGVNGAAVLLYPELMQMFAEKCECDFYLLPSSIHEFIAIPEHECKNEKLKQMVYEVNNTQVAGDEILSYSVYFYNRDKKELSVYK